jgi:hypothetical protein
MSEPGTNGPRRHRRRNQPARLRPLIAIAALLLVITPIAWILFRGSEGGLAAENSVPYVTLDDDRYQSTADHEEPIVDSTPDDIPETATTPSDSPGPSMSPTPSRLSSESPRPTNRPTVIPTGAVTVPASTRPSDRPSTDPTGTPTTITPSPDPTTTPADDGGMHPDEEELFTLINNERMANGCATLQRNTRLTLSSRGDASGRAKRNDLNDNGGSYVAVGGDGMSGKRAMDRIRTNNPRVLQDCDLEVLGVGQGKATYESCTFLIICTSKTRVSWVADFW